MGSLRFALVVALVFAAGCRGKVVGTAELRGSGSANVEFQSSGEPLVLWADTDGDWRDNLACNPRVKQTQQAYFPVHYEIDVHAKGAKIGHVACDTVSADAASCRATSCTNESYSANCELRLTCRLPPIPAGPASLSVVGSVGAAVASVRRMSINVRQK